MANWDWTLISQIAGPVIGALLGGFVGYLVGRLLERKRHKAHQHDYRRRLLTQLHAFDAEIKEIRQFFNSKIKFGTNIKLPDKPPETPMKNTYLSSLSEIPLEETTQAVKWIGWVYSSFDKVNEICQALKKKIDAPIGIIIDPIEQVKIDRQIQLHLKKANAGHIGIKGLIAKLESAVSQKRK